MENLTPLQEIAEKYYLETQENIRLMKENMSLMDEIDKCRKRSIEMADYGIKACAAIHRLTAENIELEKKAHEAINELLCDIQKSKS
jgi:Mg2+ and Co2+ transporter CorA